MVPGGPGPSPSPRIFIWDWTVRSPVRQKWPGTGPDWTSPTLLCCIIIFPMAARHDFPDSFLTHIILHAGRIFQQWHHNHTICLVIESALHVYKGQFSPWFGQFRHNWNSHIMGILIQWNSSTQLQALYSLNAQPPDLESQKLSDLVSNLCQHCFQYQLPGSIDTWESPSQIRTTHTWLTPECVLGIGNQERKECFEQQSNQLYKK